MANQNMTTSEALHIELCDALAELAKSVKIAMNRSALRAELAATITDTAKAMRVAKALRGAAYSNDRAEQNQASFVPLPPTTEPIQQEIWTRAAPSGEAVSVEYIEAYEQILEDRRKDGVLTTPILALYDEFGGFTKQ
jgi:hypothetical protein